MPSRVDALLSEFQADGWDSNPYDRMLEIAHSDVAELLELVLRAINELDQSTTFVDGALSFLSEAQFDAAVREAVSSLKRQAPSEDGEAPAESVVAYASLQFPHLLAPHLPALWVAVPNRRSYYVGWPWRAAPVEERQRLLAVLTTGSSDERELAWRALIETRDPITIAAALSRSEAVKSVLHSPPAHWLPGVGYDEVEGTLRRLAPLACFHIVMPDHLITRWDRPSHLRPENHPTWSGLGEPITEASLGGQANDTCGDCGGNLHRLLRLDAIPEGLGISRRESLELATCLSCLGWSEPFLFYEHDDAGFAHPIERRSVYTTPEWPAEPLADGTVGLVPTPPRWVFQDWAASNSRENLNRLGGEPTWIQDADYPSCPRCGAVMTALLQLDSELSVEGGGEWLWGSGGIGYVTWCDGCSISGVTAQWT